MSGEEAVGAAESMDALVRAPEHHRLLFENERVRVLDTRIGPGEQTAIHSHEWPAALYVLSWSDFIRYDQSGIVMLDSRTLGSAPPVGSSFWIPPLGPHYVRNVGNTDLHIIATEVKAR